MKHQHTMAVTPVSEMVSQSRIVCFYGCRGNMQALFGGQGGNTSQLLIQIMMVDYF